MIPFTLAVLFALCTQTAHPPTDEQVLAALPATDAIRTDVAITKTPTKRLATRDEKRPAVSHWECVVFYTEVVGDVPIRRVRVVYLETVGP